MTTPVRDITKGITAHFRAGDRAVYEVVEEIKRAFKKLQAMLDKPTLGGGIPGSPGTDGQAGGGGLDSPHIYDGTTPVKVKEPTTDPRLLRVVGTVGDRLSVSKFYSGVSQSLNVNPVNVLLTDSTVLQGTPPATVYRGIRQYGALDVRLAADGSATGPGPNLVHNGTFDGSTFSTNWMTDVPNQWVFQGDASLVLDAGGNYVSLPLSAGAAVAARNQTVIATGDYRCNSIGGALALSAWTVSYIPLEKNKVYTLTFEAKSNAGSTKSLKVAIYAQPNTTQFGECSSGRYTLDGTTTSGGVTATASSWTFDGTGRVIILDIPSDDIWRTYTITVDTTGVGVGVGDPFTVDLLFESNPTSSGAFGVRNIGWRDPNTVVSVPTVVHAPIIIRGFADDEWEITPEVTGDGNELTIAGAEGGFFKPIMAPIIGSGAVGGVVASYGLRAGFGYNGSEVVGSEAFSEVASIFAEEPEFGADPQAIITAGVISLRGGKALRFYGPTTGKYTSLRAQDQSLNIDLQLPLSSPANDGDVLAAHLTGVTYWTPQSGGSGGGSGYPPQLGYAGI